MVSVFDSGTKCFCSFITLKKNQISFVLKSVVLILKDNSRDNETRPRISSLK